MSISISVMELMHSVTHTYTHTNTHINTYTHTQTYRQIYTRTCAGYHNDYEMERVQRYFLFINITWILPGYLQQTPGYGYTRAGL